MARRLSSHIPRRSMEELLPSLTLTNPGASTGFDGIYDSYPGFLPEEKINDWEETYTAERHSGVSYDVRTKRRARHVLAILVLSLHTLPFFFYIGMVVAWALGSKVGSYITFSVNPSILNAAAHAVMMVLSVAMLFSMQAVAIRIQFERMQTLTSLSDYASAWTGLGNSMIILYRNFRLSAVMFPVFITTVYLSSLAGLQTATPLLFSASASQTSSYERATIIGFPNFSDFISSANVSNGTQVALDWSRVSPFISLLDSPLSHALSLPGIVGSCVHDTLVPQNLDDLEDPESPQITTTVNVTAFEVVCGRLQEEPVVTSSRLSNESDGWHLLSFTSEYNGGTILNTTDVFSWNRTLFDDTYTRILNTTLGGNIVIYSVFNKSALLPSASNTSWNGCTYKDGSHAPSASCDPAADLLNNTLQVDLDGDGGSNSSISLQVLGCSINASSHTSTLFGQHIAPSDFQYCGSSSGWVNLSQYPSPARWSPSPNPDSAHWLNASGWWSSMFTPQSLLPLARAYPCPSSPTHNVSLPCHSSNVVEKYLSAALYSKGALNVFSEMSYISQLEVALQRATATMVWASARSNTLALLSQDPVAPLSDIKPMSPQHGFAQANMTWSVSLSGENHLIIDPIALIFAVLSSITLLAASIAILRPRLKKDASILRPAPVPLHGFSMLELTSLDTSLVARRLARANNHNTMSLRRAGLFNVQVVDTDDGNGQPLRRRLVPTTDDCPQDEAELDGASQRRANTLVV